MSATIWWIRRDLRLFDNPALKAAADNGEQVIPLFILDDFLWASPYARKNRIAFLLDGLRRLDESLQERGSRLIVRRGRPLEVLTQLIQERPIQGIYAQDDYSPYMVSELPLIPFYRYTLSPTFNHIYYHLVVSDYISSLWPNC